MRPICSFASAPCRRPWVLGASHALGMVLAMLVAVCLRLGWRDGMDYLATHHITISASSGILWVAFGTAGFYDSRRLEGLGRTLAAGSVAVLGGTLLATGLLWATSPWQTARGILLVFALLALLAMLATRLAYRLLLRLGFMTSRCLVIGTGGEAQKVIDLIHRHPQAGLQVVGMVQHGQEQGLAGTWIEAYPILETDVSLEHVVQAQRIDRLIVASPDKVEITFLRHLRSLRYRGLQLADYGSLHEELTREISVEHINDEWLFAASMTNSRPYIRRFKRAFDIVGSIGVSLLTAPIAAAAALLVKLDSPGPVLYRQERLGRDGIGFTILKFRTMIADAESQTGPVWAIDGDLRATRVGQWLRKFRVDELPQLINVLRGEMSLIGPRPEREVFVKQLSEQIPFYAERLMVAPGITGWAQVMQSYAASVEESRRKFQADLYYIKHMSLLTDMYIMLKTVKVVFTGRERSPSAEAPVVARATPFQGMKVTNAAPKRARLAASGSIG